MAMIRCAFLEVHVEEEMFAEFGDVDSIEDVGNESVEQNGPLGEGWWRQRSSKSRGRGLGRGNGVDGNPTNVGCNDAQTPTRDFVNLGESEPRESTRVKGRGTHFQ